MAAANGSGSGAASATPPSSSGIKHRRKSKAQKKAAAAALQIAQSPSPSPAFSSNGAREAARPPAKPRAVAELLASSVPPPPPSRSASPSPSPSRPSTPLRHSRLALDLPISPLKSLMKPAPNPHPMPTAMSPTSMQRMQRIHNLQIQTDLSLPTPSASPPVSPSASAADRPRLLSRAAHPSPPPHHGHHAPFRLADFLYKEVFGVHDIKSSDAVHQERVQNFLVVPYNTEQLFGFGVFLALDSFLYVFTYLPLRMLFACGCAVTSVSLHTRIFHRTHFYDLMVAVLIAVGTSVLWQVDMSRMYHAIRGQAMIKLYVLFTMIEIFDRLFSSLGQDVLDSLYFTARFHPRRVTRMAMDCAVALVYVVLHALLLFAQVVTINVAINSSNSSLLTLLISNNFAELKSCVFKKFEEQNLFQIACSDIVERFKLLLIIALIMLQSNARDVAYGTTMVMLAEMLIDWLKHAFITKFNQIPPSVYSKFITILCRDLTGWKNQDTILDHTHHVSRRLGLVSLPLACVVLRMVSKALYDRSPITLASPSGVLITLAVFLCLAAFKTLLSLVLMIYACRSGRLDDTRPKSPRAVRQLESIQRYKF